MEFLLCSYLVDHEMLLQQNMKYAKQVEERQAEEDEELVQYDSN
jgi:hypothetical protein